MADNPISLNEVRANRTQDGRDWTVLDCLKALVRDLEDGTMAPVDGVYVAMVRFDERRDVVALPFYSAGVSGIESSGLMAKHLIRLTAG